MQSNNMCGKICYFSFFWSCVICLMNYFQILPISARIPVKWVDVNRMGDVWRVCGAGAGVCNGLFHLRAAILGSRTRQYING